MTFDRALAALEAARGRFLAVLKGVGEDAFARVPPGETWSAAHVTEHLIRVETRVVLGARRALEKGRGAQPTWWDPLQKLTYWSGLAALARIRTVGGLDPARDPPAPMALAGQLERFALARAATATFVSEVRDRDLSRIWLRHPFFGAFRVPDMLGWVAWHEDRHRRQLERILRRVRERA